MKAFKMWNLQKFSFFKKLGLILILRSFLMKQYSCQYIELNYVT